MARCEALLKNEQGAAMGGEWLKGDMCEGVWK